MTLATAPAAKVAAARSEKITFPGSQGATLAARLDLPAGPPRAYALFAHCFTCSKDILAASRIAASLAARGLAVLRFDFTGLGASEGEFANTNFSSNVADLVAAADYLRAHFAAPQILIGHSLGGAAVLVAAHDIAEVRAVATIGAPADAIHVTHNFHAHVEEIASRGVAEVELSGRRFTIRKQFLDDLQSQSVAERVANLRRALLILHSPVDQTVGIENAQILYQAAKHPKSFVSLDDADHLLRRGSDAAYAADVLAAWATRYLDPIAEPKIPSLLPVEDGWAVVEETGESAYTNAAIVRGHRLIADEPGDLGGANLGPTPTDFLKVALASCTSITLRMYAARKGLDVRKIAVRVRHDSLPAEAEGARPRDLFTREIVIDGALDADARARMLAIADRCPVHRTLEAEALVRTVAVGPR